MKVKAKVVVGESFTVSFDLGYETSLTVPSQTIEKGKSATKPSEPTRVGYDFLGWFTTTDVLFDFSSLINSNTVLKAKWVVVIDTRIKISTVEEFKAMSEGNEYLIVNDLDFADEVYTDNLFTLLNWSIDGGNHTIKNLTINSPAGNYGGIFETAGNLAKLENIIFQNIRITALDRAGLLIGQTLGTSATTDLYKIDFKNIHIYNSTVIAKQENGASFLIGSVKTGAQVDALNIVIRGGLIENDNNGVGSLVGVIDGVSGSVNASKTYFSAKDIDVITKLVANGNAEGTKAGRGRVAGLRAN